MRFVQLRSSHKAWSFHIRTYVRFVYLPSDEITFKYCTPPGQQRMAYTYIPIELHIDCSLLFVLMQSSTVAALSWSRNGFRSVGLLVTSHRFFKTFYNLGFVLCVWGYLWWFRVNNVRYSSYMVTAKFSIIQHEGKNSWLSFARSKPVPSPRLRCKYILYFFFRGAIPIGSFACKRKCEA